MGRVCKAFSDADVAIVNERWEQGRNALIKVGNEGEALNDRFLRVLTKGLRRNARDVRGFRVLDVGITPLAQALREECTNRGL